MHLNIFVKFKFALFLSVHSDNLNQAAIVNNSVLNRSKHYFYSILESQIYIYRCTQIHPYKRDNIFYFSILFIQIYPIFSVLMKKIMEQKHYTQHNSLTESTISGLFRVPFFYILT